MRLWDDPVSVEYLSTKALHETKVRSPVLLSCPGYTWMIREGCPGHIFSGIGGRERGRPFPVRGGYQVMSGSGEKGGD